MTFHFDNLWRVATACPLRKISSRKMLRRTRVFKIKMPMVIWALNVIFFEGLHNLLSAQISVLAKVIYNGITVASKSAGPAGLPSEKFAGPQASLRAIGPTARLACLF